MLWLAGIAGASCLFFLKAPPVPDLNDTHPGRGHLPTTHDGVSDCIVMCNVF